MEVIESYELSSNLGSMQELSKKIVRCNLMVSYELNHANGTVNSNRLAFTHVEPGKVGEAIDKFVKGEIESTIADVGMWINIYPDNTFTITKEPL